MPGPDARTRGGLTGAQAPHRVCFVATGLGRGGAEGQLYQAAIGLRSRGFDVHVISILPSDYYRAQLEAHGVPVTCLGAARTSAGALRTFTRLVQLVRDLNPAALVGFNDPAAILSRAAGMFARVPVVVSSIHTVNHGSRLRRLALAWTDRLATVTTAVSHPVARTLVEMGVPSARVQVIPNGVDVLAVGPHLRVGRAALRRSIGVGDHEFLWVAAGRLETPKDYPNLLAAMAALSTGPTPVRLAIAGQGPLREEIRRQVAALRLDGVVSLLGLRDDVPACMAAADATVLASAWEGLPTVAIESLAVETPIVCTDVGGVREIVEDGRSGFVAPPRNSDALASAMAAMMACSEERRRQMGAAGRKHIEDQFALDHVLGCWSGLLNDLVGAVA
jgi:glycosyltransferase involved in cell wall biosynthesis